MNPLPAIGGAINGAAQTTARFCKWTTAHFWMGVASYALAGWLFWCFLIVDASFIRPLAPASIDADTFQHVAWGYRVFGLICIAMTVALFAFKKWLWGGITLVLAVVCSVILFGHAIGLSFKSMEEQYASGAVVTKVESVSVEEINEQIADIDQRRKEIREDKEGEVQRLQSSIDGIVNDGLDNDDEAQDFRDDQTAAEIAAKSALDKLDADRSALVAKRQEARTGAATQSVEQRSFNPFFVGLARFQTGQWKPGEPVDETSSYTSGLAFFAIFFAFGELLMMLMPGLGSTFLLMHAEKRKGWGADIAYSDAVPDGYNRVDFTDEEYAEYLRAMEKHKNTMAGAKKAVETKAEKKEREERLARQTGKIEAGKAEMERKVSDFLTDRNTGMSIAQVAEKHGTTVAAIAIQYRNYMSDEQYALLFGFGYNPFNEPATLGDYMPPTDEPEAQEPEPPVAMADSPQAAGVVDQDNALEENDIQEDLAENEPVSSTEAASPEYGVDLWKPPANDDPDNKEAA